MYIYMYIYIFDPCANNWGSYIKLRAYAVDTACLFSLLRGTFLYSVVGSYPPVFINHFLIYLSLSIIRSAITYSLVSV